MRPARNPSRRQSTCRGVSRNKLRKASEDSKFVLGKKVCARSSRVYTGTASAMGHLQSLYNRSVGLSLPGSVQCEASMAVTVARSCHRGVRNGNLAELRNVADRQGGLGACGRAS